MNKLLIFIFFLGSLKSQSNFSILAIAEDSMDTGISYATSSFRHMNGYEFASQTEFFNTYDELLNPASDQYALPTNFSELDKDELKRFISQSFILINVMILGSLLYIQGCYN